LTAPSVPPFVEMFSTVTCAPPGCVGRVSGMGETLVTPFTRSAAAATDDVSCACWRSVVPGATRIVTNSDGSGLCASARATTSDWLDAGASPPGTIRLGRRAANTPPSTISSTHAPSTRRR